MQVQLEPSMPFDPTSDQMYRIVLQARAGSTRLPGKMTRAFWSGKSIPQVIVEELARIFPSPMILLATTNGPGDDVLEHVANDLGIGCYRGEEDDVLSRVLSALRPSPPKYMVRVCADNPFLRAEFVLELLEQTTNQNFDYVSYRSQTGVPAILTHFGLFAEVVRVSTLRRIAVEVRENRYREHLTSHILDHPIQYECCFLSVPAYIERAGQLRLTVDTERDFEICQAIFREVTRRYGMSFSAKQLIETISLIPSELRADMAQQIRANQK